MIRAEAPEGANVLDLAALRAARQEVRAAAGKTVSVIKLAAGYIEVVAEVPLEAAFAFETGDLKGGLGLMLVDPADVDALLGDGLTGEDIKAISTFLKADLGEAAASS